MDWSLPSTDILILTILMSTVRFENQRWIRARIQGLKGRNQWVGFFVDLTGFLGTIFSCVFLAAYFYDNGFESILILLATLFISGILITLLFNKIFRGDNVFVWIISTILMWPLTILLFFKVSWFGVL